MSDILARLQGLFRTEHDNQEMLRRTRRDISRAERNNATHAEARRDTADSHYQEHVRAEADRSGVRAMFANDRPLEHGREPSTPAALERYDSRAGVGTGEGLFRSPSHRMLNQMEQDRPSLPLPNGRKASITDVLNTLAEGPDRQAVERAVQHHYNRHMRVRPELDRRELDPATRDAARELAAATEADNVAHGRHYTAADAAERPREDRPRSVDTRRSAIVSDVLAEADPAEHSGPGTYRTTRQALDNQRGTRPPGPTRSPAPVDRHDPTQERPENDLDILRRRRALEALSNANVQT